MSTAQPTPASPSPLTTAGLAMPGLGHLLQGRFIDGIGLLMLSSSVFWAAVSGFPRMGELLFAPGGPDFRIHPWIALVGWLLAVFLLWQQAIRLRWPAPRDLERERTSQLRIIWKQFIKNRVGVLGMYLVFYLVLMAVLTPFIAPFDPDQIDVGERLAAPSWAHPMGTDEFRRDLFSRVMYGARISLSIGVIAVSLSASIGTAIGAIAGYYGGWADKLLMWVTDLLLSLPRLVLLMAIVGLFRAAGAQTIFLIVVILGLTGWMGIARIVRSQVLSLKEQDFIQATRALGLPDSRIIVRHLVPNTLAYVIVYASLATGSMILVEAALSFLGLGVPPPTATWGSIVNDGREYLRGAPWITFFPGVLIVFAVLSFNLLGDGLRDALDPKLRGRG